MSLADISSSDEDSFVILETSPSLEYDGADAKPSSTTSIDGFPSLITNQINDLKDAQEIIDAADSNQLSESQDKTKEEKEALIKLWKKSIKEKEKTLSDATSELVALVKSEMQNAPVELQKELQEICIETLEETQKPLTEQAKASLSKQQSRAQTQRESRKPLTEEQIKVLMELANFCEQKSRAKTQEESQKPLTEQAKATLSKQQSRAETQEESQKPLTEQAKASLSKQQSRAETQKESQKPLTKEQKELVLKVVNLGMQQSRAECQKKKELQENTACSIKPNVTELPIDYFVLNCPHSDQSEKKNEQINSADSNLAASFILGEIDSDVLKSTIYSQFPSMCLDGNTEDVNKLKNMMSENAQLKAMLRKANEAMKYFHEHTSEWKHKMLLAQDDNKQQLDNLKKEIKELRQGNLEIVRSSQMQIDAIQIARKEDREEYIKAISEKNALIENMRVQIAKLEQQQLTSFEVAASMEDRKQLQHVCAINYENQFKIQNLEGQMSQLLASNLDFKDLEKQYLDELNCLKTNLVTSEEVIKQNRREIIGLQSENMEKNQQITGMEAYVRTLKSELEQQSENIAVLREQNKLYHSDFQLEKECRETAVREREQILEELRAMQKQYGAFVKEQEKIAEKINKKKTVVPPVSNFNNPQRPIRVLPSTSSAPPSGNALHVCPVCNKCFKSINNLLGHVNDCVDNI